MMREFTDAELEAERAALDKFHAMRKSNSTRRERQAAYHEAWIYLERRRARAWAAHPIQPAARWSDLEDTSPKGWSYECLRTLEDAEVDAMFPGARAAFATQCDDIPRSRFVFDQWNSKDGRLKLSTPLGFGGQTTTWLPEVGIWRRYCRHISSKPWNRAQSEPVAEGT